MARKEAELKAREEALKQREEIARKDARLKAQQEAMRQREAAQKARAMAAAARKAGGQRQSSGVPPIPPKQIAQQERAEEKKKMVKFALLSFAVFAVIVSAFIFFGSSEEKPKKNTGSEEVSCEGEHPRGNYSTPQDESQRRPPSHGFMMRTAQDGVPATDSATNTTQGVKPASGPKKNEDKNNQSKKKDKSIKNATGNQDAAHGDGNEQPVSPASGNPAPEASSSSDAID